MIHIENVYQVYPSRSKSNEDFVALNGITLNVPEGCFFTLIGPSGCGKSTLLRLITGLETPFFGQILIHGQPVVESKYKCTVVWQDFALMDWRTVLENVAFGLEIQGMDRKQRRERAMEQLQMVGLSQFANHYPNQLSGGMKQRVGIARALAVDPDVLLMDEPFGALDAQTRLVMQEETLRIWEQWGKTVIFVTHSLDEALLLSDQIALFTASPGHIKEVVPVPFVRPRTPSIRNSNEYTELYDHLYSSLRNEVQATMQREYLREKVASR